MSLGFPRFMPSYNRIYNRAYYNNLRKYNNWQRKNNVENDQGRSAIQSRPIPLPVLPEDTASKKDEEEKRNTQDDVRHIDILGLRLNFDDILIVGLLYFLYTEGVDDKELFISLILLLIGWKNFTAQELCNKLY